MFPHRFNPSHGRPHSDRSPRLWNSHGDSRERRDPHRERERPVHPKYSAEGERTSRRRDYKTSTNRPHRKDSFDADRSRWSPLRKRMSSPGWESSERNRQSFEGEGSHNHDNANDGEEGHYRFRHVSEGKTRQWSSARSDICGTKDLEDAEFQGRDFRHTKRSPDHRPRHHCEDVTYGHHRDCDSRPSSGSHNDRDGHRSGYCLPDRKPSEGQSSKYYESDVAQSQAAVPQQSTSAKGFQRFLDLLNKGVDVDMLNKIVGQMPSSHQAHSSHSTVNVDGQRDVTQQQRTDDRGECGAPRWQVSKQSGQRRSPNPERSSHPTGSRSRSRSPQRVDKVTPTPEDEHKHKQMQDVLQAIGLNLGFEELGQMSHRIQERLYGKRESDGRGSEGKSKEKDSRRGRVPSPRSQSRSSSSSSSQSPSPPERHPENFSFSGQTAGPRDEHPGDQHPGDQHPGDQHPGDQHPGDQPPGDQHQHQHQHQHPGDQHPEDQQAATYSYQRHFPPPVVPTYPPANYPLLSYPPPPALPHMPPVPALFLPPRPPMHPPPQPPYSMFPTQMAHASYCPPQYAVGPQPWFNPLVQPMNNNNNNQKTKMPSRPRCLQVIETKQAG